MIQRHRQPSRVLAGPRIKRRLSQRSWSEIRDRIHRLRFRDPIEEIFMDEAAKRYIEDFEKIERLAKDFHLPKVRFIRYLKEIGLYDRLEYYKVPIIRSYHRTKSLENTGRKFNTTGSNLGKRLRAWGIEIYDTKEEVIQRIHTSKNEMIDLYVNKKMSAGDVARRLGFAPDTVRTYLRRWGIELRKRPSRVKEMCRLHDDGYTPNEIAKQMGLRDSSQVYMSLKACGRGTDIHDPRTFERMRQLYKQGKSVEQIADRFSTTVPSVRGRIAGVKRVRRPNFSTRVKKRIIRMYRDEKRDTWQISQKVNYAQTLVEDFLLSMGYKGVRKKWTRAEKERILREIIKFRNQGKQTRFIRKTLNIPYVLVGQLRDEYNLAKVAPVKPRRGRVLTVERELALVRYYRSKPQSIGEAGAKFGLTNKQAQYILTGKYRTPLWRVKGARYSPEDTKRQNEIIFRLYKEGKSMRAIEAAAGIDRTSVKRRLIQANLWIDKVGGLGGHQYFPWVWEDIKFRVTKYLFQGKKVGWIGEKMHMSTHVIERIPNQKFKLNRLYVFIFDKRKEKMIKSPTFEIYRDAARFSEPYRKDTGRYNLGLIMRKI